MPKQQFRDADDMMVEMTSFMGEAKETARIRTVWTSVIAKMLKLLLQTSVAQKQVCALCPVLVVSAIGCFCDRRYISMCVASRVEITSLSRDTLCIVWAKVGTHCWFTVVHNS